MIFLYLIISIFAVLLGVWMMALSDNFGDYLGSTIVFAIGWFLLFITISEAKTPTLPDVISITSKDNKTFTLKIDKPNLKFEQDSLSYCEVDSIIKKIK